MPDINKHEIDIENLFKQNENDLSSIKELYKRIGELGEKITKIKYIDSALTKKLKKEYESLKKQILDENIQFELREKIEETITKLKSKSNEFFIEEFTGDTDTEKINNAINSIADIGTIRLKNKIYNFNNFVLSKGVNLIGSGNTVINSLGNGTLIKATNENIISDITINDNGFSIKAIDLGQIGGSETNFCNNSSISNVVVNLTNITSEGIRVGHGSNNKVLNTTVINSATNGEGESTGIGIAIYSDSPNTCKDVFITNNYVKGFYYGIAPWGTGTRINVQVDGNIVEDCVNIGINMYHSTLSQVLNNNVYNCKMGIFADTTSYNGSRGRGTIVSNNSVSNCSEIGIYCEELRGAVVSNNAVQGCNIGLYAGASTCYTSFSNNTLTFNTTGLLISNEHVPSQMRNYDNSTNIIKGNVIFCNAENGICLKGFRGLYEISDNYIHSNNTSNGNFYGIYFARDVIEEIERDRACESIIVKNNIIFCSAVDGTTGYQGGIYNAGGSAGQIILINNYMQNKNIEMYLTGFNNQSVIKDNVVLSTATITKPNCKIVNNIGIEEGNTMVTNTTGIKFNLGINSVDELPTASSTEQGRLIRVNRRSDNGSTYIDDEYYICIRTANGSYSWKKITLA